MNFSEKLKEIRKNEGISQEQLAENGRRVEFNSQSRVTM